MEQRVPSPAKAPQQTNPHPSCLPPPDTPAGLPSWALDVTSLRSASMPAREGKDPDCPNSIQMPWGAARPVPGPSRCPVSCLVPSPPLSLLTHTSNRPILTSPLGFQARLRLWGLYARGAFQPQQSQRTRVSAAPCQLCSDVELGKSVVISAAKQPHLGCARG